MDRQIRTWPTIISAALAFLAGVLVVQWLPNLPSRWLLLTLLGGCLWLLRYAPWRWLAIAALGFIWAAWRGSAAIDARLPANWEGQDFNVTGYVDGLPQTRVDATSFVFQIEQMTRAGQRVSWQGTARVNWYGTPPPTLVPCARWQLLLRLRRPRGLINPGGLDAERSALTHAVAALGYVRNDSTNQQRGITSWCIDRLRASLASDIQTRVTDAHDAALLRAFTVGDTRALNVSDWEVARANGITHLIAISGFHVGVAAIFGVWLCSLFYMLFPAIALRIPRAQAQPIAALILAFAYTALAGFGMPTVRTVLMIAVVAMARMCRRVSRTYEALALALMAMLCVDPLAVLSAGFWLSFVGVAFLIVCLETPGRGLGAFVRELTLGQMVITVALLPLTLWFFGEASLVGALSNLIAVPFVSFVIVPCALISLLLLLTIPALATPVLQLAGWLTHAQWWLLEQTATWPGAHWYLPSVQWWTLGLAMLGALWLCMPRGVALRSLGVLLFLPLLWPMQQVPVDGAFQAWMLDVGQGLSIIVRTHQHTLVYDMGARYPSGFDMGSAVVIPAMHALGIDHLDALMVSHADNDHAGGAQAVVAAFPQARRYAGEPDRMAFPMQACLAGQQWVWDRVHFRVLSPQSEKGNSSANDRSCVLLIEGSAGRLLLTGDIAADTEKQLVRTWKNDGIAPVLQIPHHGSKSSSKESFIATIKPTFAVVSAGWRNRFGHPRPEVLERYAKAGVSVVNTAKDGAIEMDFPADSPAYIAARWRLRERRYWRE